MVLSRTRAVNFFIISHYASCDLKQSGREGEIHKGKCMGGYIMYIEKYKERYNRFMAKDHESELKGKKWENANK